MPRTRRDSGDYMNSPGGPEAARCPALSARDHAVLDRDSLADHAVAGTSSGELTPGSHSSAKRTQATSMSAFTTECGNDRLDDGQACERAVAAAEQRIASVLADPVIRDLFGIGLTLEGAWPHVTEAGQPRLTAAIDGIDQVIRTIRDVVFALAPRPTASSEGTAGVGDTPGRRARADRGIDDRP